MTDPSDREKRVDLRALDSKDDASRTEAAIRAVMSRVAKEAVHEPHNDDIAPLVRDDDNDIARLLRARRRLAVVAAVLAGIAATALLASPRQAVAGDDPLSSWAMSSHVPTNGELLAVFHGYTP